MQEREACKRIHKVLESLPKWREPSYDMPKNGIYFFYEEGESTPHTGKQRIVRVGTHGTKKGIRRVRTLRQRLRDHYKDYKNHTCPREGSIFRKHLGSALLKRAGGSERLIKEWMRGRKSLLWDTKNEFKETEQKVGEVLRSRFFFRVIHVNNAEERKVFEKKLIATISACPVCRPSEKWLGNFARSEKVRRSGLWNSNFVDSPARLTEKDLMRLEQLACETSR